MSSRFVLLCCFVFGCLCQSPQRDTMDSLRQFVVSRQLAIPGTKADLQQLAAQVTLVESFLSLSTPLTQSNLTTYLTSRGMSTNGTLNDLFDRCFAQMSIERNILSLSTIRSVADLNATRLSSELSNLNFSAQSLNGLPMWQLADIFGQALTDISTIKAYFPDFVVSVGAVSSRLRQTGLNAVGSLGDLLSQLAQSVSFVSPQLSDQCSLIVTNSLCVSNGSKVVAPNPTLIGLAGAWTFDDQKPIDQSGNGLQINGSVTVGTGRAGRGASAALNSNGTQMFSVPHSAMMSSPTLTVTLWVYLRDDSNNNWRTLLHKGSKDSERTPTLMLEPSQRGVEFLVSTTDTTQPNGERVWSSSVIPIAQWTHIAAVAQHRSLQLFINGMLDAENSTVGDILTNQGPMYVGNDPWRTKGATGCLIDDLRYYSRALSSDEIAAEAGLIETGAVATDSVALACSGCTVDMCVATCKRWKPNPNPIPVTLLSPPTPSKAPRKSLYRMCTALDMMSGAYLAMRSRGWVASFSQVWMAPHASGNVRVPTGMGMTGGSSDSAVAGDPNGVCVCCRVPDIDFKSLM